MDSLRSGKATLELGEEFTDELLKVNEVELLVVGDKDWVGDNGEIEEHDEELMPDMSSSGIEDDVVWLCSIIICLSLLSSNCFCSCDFICNSKMDVVSLLFKSTTEKELGFGMFDTSLNDDRMIFK